MGSRPLFILLAKLFFTENMDKSKIADRISEIAERVAAENNLELVNTEVLGNERELSVQIFIDKADAASGGVTHEDCANLSFHVGTILDVEDFIQPAYTLVVSSPGIERGLYKLKDFVRFTGQNAKLKTRQPIDAQRNFRGRIAGVEGENILFEDKTRGAVTIPFAIVSKANLEVDLTEELKRAPRA